MALQWRESHNLPARGGLGQEARAEGGDNGGSESRGEDFDAPRHVEEHQSGNGDCQRQPTSDEGGATPSAAAPGAVTTAFLSWAHGIGIGAPSRILEGSLLATSY